MSTLGASRFTALLAAVAISGMAGTFWWALETRSGMKAAAGHRGVVRAAPKFSGRVTKAIDERPPAKVESSKFELMGKSERLQAGAPGRSTDQEAAPMLANYPGPAPSPSAGPLPIAAPSPGFQSPGFQIPSLPVPGPQSPDAQNPATPGSRADMPLPALPASPPPAQPDPTPSPTASWQSKFPQQPFLIPPAPVAPQPAETPRHQTRSASAARTPKPAAQSYYIEKYLDQGEYHLRRRPCEPPNMPDVCFMPQADRQPVLVSKP